MNLSVNGWKGSRKSAQELLKFSFPVLGVRKEKGGKDFEVTYMQLLNYDQERVEYGIRKRWVILNYPFYFILFYLLKYIVDSEI